MTSEPLQKNPEGPSRNREKRSSRLPARQTGGLLDGSAGAGQKAKRSSRLEGGWRGLTLRKRLTRDGSAIDADDCGDERKVLGSRF
jgi:hypothetical protein